MEKICPVGFFCFDKNTFMLFIIFMIVIVVYLINKDTEKYNYEKLEYKNKVDELYNLKNKLDTMDQSVNNIKSIARDLYNETDERRRTYDPLLGPERSFPYSLNRLGIPINIKTRGDIPNYQQVGALYQENSDDNSRKVFPLYGKPTYPGSRRWLYYTGNDNFSAVKLPIDNKGRSCQDDQGCEEINDGDLIDVIGYNNKFKVNIYNLDKPRYIPFI